MSASAGSASASGRILGVLFAGVLIGALDIAIVGPALPAIQQDFGVGDRSLAWVLGIYILFNLVGAPLVAKLSDRYGRRELYAASLVIFGAGSLLVALAPAFPVLLTGRAVQAFGAGGIFPVASAVVADTFPLERRGRALGLIGAVFGMAFLVGPLLGGLLLRWGWQWLFLMNLPIVVAVVALALRVLPASSRASERKSFDFVGALLLSASLASFAWGVNRLDARALGASLSSPSVWPFLLGAVVAWPALFIVERRAADPVMPPALFRSLQLRLVGLIAFAAGLVEAGMVFLPEMAVDAFRVPASTASFMLLPLVLTLIVGAPTAGRLLDRVGPRPVIQTGLVFTALGLSAFGLLPLTYTTFYAGGALVGLGLSSLLGAPLRYVVLQEAGDERRGAGQGLLTLFLSIGQLVGSAAIGGIAASAANATHGYATALLVLAGVSAVVLPATLVLRPKAPLAGQARRGGAPDEAGAKT
ncbi:MAG TPA: MFS transporter [Gammaproteobacteria bacterium]|nr:MFS transporter [Gammaproteobacteria bacterium]